MKLKNFTQKDRHGNMISYDFYESDDNMGVPEMQGIPQHPGSPKGTDTVPAWLTPGEFVMNAEATRMFEPQIEQMNNAGRAVQAQQGGTIPEYAASGKKITKRKMPNGKIGLWQGNTYLGMHEEGPSFLGDISEAAKEGWEEWNPFKSNGGSVPPVYLAEGSGGFFDKLLNMFSDDDTPKVPDATQAVVPPPDSSRADRVAALVEASKTNGPTRPDPTISNKMYMDFLKNKEGFRNEAYLDSAGVPTIGYGFTEGVQMGDTIDEKTANERLLKEMAKTDQDYNKLVTADLNPNQQAAVKSLLYNIGGPQFANSKARAALNAGDFESFKKEAAEFRMADGKVIPGLENRRRDELELFFKPYKADRPETSNAPMSMVSPEEQAAFQRDVEAAQKATREQGMYDPDGAGAANKAVAEQSRILEDQQRMQQGQVPPVIGAAVPPKPTDDPLVSTVPPSNTSRDDRVDVLSNAAKGGNTVIGTLQGNDVYQDDLGEYINTPEGPVYLDGNQLQAMTKTPASVSPSSTVPVVPPSNSSRDARVAKLTNSGTTPNVVPELKEPPKVSTSFDKNDLPPGFILNTETGKVERAPSNLPLSSDITKESDQAKLTQLESAKERRQSIIDNGGGPGDPIFDQEQSYIEKLEKETAGVKEKVDTLTDKTTKVFTDGELKVTDAEIEKKTIQAEKLVDLGLSDAAKKVEQEVKDLKDKKKRLEGKSQELVKDDQTEALDPAVPTIEGVPPKPKEKSSTTSTVTGMDDEYDEDLDSTTQTIVDRIIADDNNLPDDGTTTGQTPAAAAEAGETAPPEQIDEAESFLSGIFGDLFDADELKRMAIMYVGSRVMGGSHSGSLNFAAKQYVNRVDKKVATKKAEEKALAKEKRLDLKAARKQFNKNLFDLNKDPNISKASIQAYKKSYDPKTGTADSSLLEQRVKPTPMNIDGNPELYYPIDGGKPVLGQKIKTGTKETGFSTMIVDQAGNPLKTYLMHQDKSRIPKTPEFNKRVVEESGRYEKMMEALIKANTSTEDGKEIRPTDLKPSLISGDIAKWAIKNNVDPNDMGQIIGTAYESMKAENIRDPKVRHSNITKFLDGAYIPAMVGDPQLFNVPGTNSPGDLQEISKLSSTLVAKARSSKMKGISNKSDNEVKDHIYKQFAKEFKGEASYDVPDPSTGGMKTITLDEDMMKDFIEEAKKSNTSPFQLFIAQRLREPVKPK